MSKVTRIFSLLALSAALAVGAFAHGAVTKTPAPKGAAMTGKAKPAAKSDAEIQTCIEQKLGAAPKLKDQHLTVSVAGGVATFAGSAKNAGSKGGVSSIAKACGAKSVVNNITVEAPAKTAAKPAAKAAVKH